VAGAAGFALEDQLAGPPEAQHLAVSAQQPDGRVRVAIVARTLVGALTDRGARSGPLARLTRIIAEPDLAPPQAGWRWCAGDAAEGEGFVRRSDGSAFPVSVPDPAGALPAEVALAVAQARRDGAPPRAIRVDADIAESALAHWQRETGVAFARGAVWRWHAAPATAFARAIDLLQGAFALTPAVARGARARLFVPALVLAGAALALHVAATVGEWSWLKQEGWRQARAWTSLARSSGLGSDAAATPSSAQAALARRHAELRHAHGLPARDDALPLLARAAPAIGKLPPGIVRSATYADGHWTLDLARADTALVGELEARMRQTGVPALVATSAAGARVRIGAP
jgi:type II secretion system protein L